MVPSKTHDTLLLLKYTGVISLLKHSSCLQTKNVGGLKVIEAQKRKRKTGLASWQVINENITAHWQAQPTLFQRPLFT